MLSQLSWTQTQLAELRQHNKNEQDHIHREFLYKHLAQLHKQTAELAHSKYLHELVAGQHKQTAVTAIKATPYSRNTTVTAARTA